MIDDERGIGFRTAWPAVSVFAVVWATNYVIHPGTVADAVLVAGIATVGLAFGIGLDYWWVKNQHCDL